LVGANTDSECLCRRGVFGGGNTAGAYAQAACVLTKNLATSLDQAVCASFQRLAP